MMHLELLMVSDVPVAQLTERARLADARVMVIGGEITVTRGGKAQTFHVGDSCGLRISPDAGPLYLKLHPPKQDSGDRGYAVASALRTAAFREYRQTADRPPIFGPS